MPSMDVEASAIIWKTITTPDGGVFHAPVMRFNNHRWSIEIDYKYKEIKLISPIID